MCRTALATRNPNKRHWEDERRRPIDYRRFPAREIRIAWTTRASQAPRSWRRAPVPPPKPRPAATPLPAEDPQPVRLQELLLIAREGPNVSTATVRARQVQLRGQRWPAIFVRGFFRPQLWGCGTVTSPAAAARAPACYEPGCQ